MRTLNRRHTHPAHRNAAIMALITAHSYPWLRAPEPGGHARRGQNHPGPRPGRPLPPPVSGPGRGDCGPHRPALRPFSLQHGEAYFRQLEADSAARALRPAGPPLVLATGGGTPCFHDNLTVLNRPASRCGSMCRCAVLAARLAARRSGQPPPAGRRRPGRNLAARNSAAPERQFYQQAQLRCAGAACTLPAVAAAAGCGRLCPGPADIAARHRNFVN